MDAENIINGVVARVAAVPGVAAVVLGGSRATEVYASASDIDIGIYYHEASSLDLPTLRAVAEELDDEHRSDVLTEIGGWGPWINGGGWLRIAGMPVDLLYRDVARVRYYIAEAVAGRVETYYQWGHPHAFVTSIYAAEVACCRALADPDGVIQALKDSLWPYPRPLQQALIDTFLGEADFTLLVARHGLARLDVAYTAGCCFRAIACLTQVLFAANEQYLMNEKGAVARAGRFPRTVADLEGQVQAIFADLAPAEHQLARAVQRLAALVAEVGRLVN